MSLFLAKKQEDNNQKKVRDLLRLKENKKCFDCPTKSPSFVNTTIQTFVCARCSGLVREVGHRVKAVSASKFSGAELLALKQGGNGIALKIWLSNYSTHDSPEPESDADVRAFMKQKYYENKWLDRALLQSHKESVRALIAKSFTEDGLPIVTRSKSKILPGFSRVPLIADSEMNIMKDDDDEEENNFQLNQQDLTISSPPVYSPPAYSQPVSFSIPPPTSPISPAVRSSMESSHSSFSVKSSSSIHSQPQEDYVSSSRRRVSSSSRRSDTSSARESMDSTNSSAVTPATSCGSSVLSAEEIAERCRVSIDSKNVQPPKAVEEEVTATEPEPVVEQKVVPPSLQIDVAEANKNFNQYQQQQQELQEQEQKRYKEYQEQQQLHYKEQQQLHYKEQQQKRQQQQQQQQLKTPTLINYGNSIQSPTSVNGNVSPSASPVVTPSTSKTLNTSSAFESIIMELSGLKLEKTARRATYTGGILSPASTQTPLTPSTSTDETKSTAHPASVFDPSVFAKPAAPQPLPENDLYAALRGIPSPVVHVPKEEPKEEIKETAFSEDDEDEDDPWQEFCSSSSVDEDITTPPAQVIQPIVENAKPMITMDIFGDLDPRAMFKRF